MTRSTQWLATLVALGALAGVPAANTVCAASCGHVGTQGASRQGASPQEASPQEAGKSGADQRGGAVPATTACHERAGRDRTRISAAPTPHCTGHALTAAEATATVVTPGALARAHAWRAPALLLGSASAFSVPARRPYALSRALGASPLPIALRV